MSASADIKPSPRLAGACEGAGVRQILFAACEQAGGQRAWARQHGVSVSLVSEVLSGRRSAAKSIAIANALRLIHVDAFLPMQAAPTKETVA